MKTDQETIDKLKHLHRRWQQRANLITTRDAPGAVNPHEKELLQTRALELQSCALQLKELISDS